MSIFPFAVKRSGSMVKVFYQDMSGDVAIQGIAQDVVTLCIALPLLLTALYFARKGSIKGRIILSLWLYTLFLSYIPFLFSNGDV